MKYPVLIGRWGKGCLSFALGWSAEEEDASLSTLNCNDTCAAHTSCALCPVLRDDGLFDDMHNVLIGNHVPF
jgi:hypothetical protein